VEEPQGWRATPALHPPLNIEMRVPPGIQPNFKISFRADLFDGSGLAVSNPLVPVRRGELHTVTGGEVPFRLSRLSSFVFINIPASCRAAEDQLFVFIYIPASFRQNRNLFQSRLTVKSRWLAEETCQQIIFLDSGGCLSPRWAEALRWR